MTSSVSWPSFGNTSRTWRMVDGAGMMPPRKKASILTMEALAPSLSLSLAGLVVPLRPAFAGVLVLFLAAAFIRRDRHGLRVGGLLLARVEIPADRRTRGSAEARADHRAVLAARFLADRRAGPAADRPAYDRPGAAFPAGGGRGAGCAARRAADHRAGLAAERLADCRAPCAAYACTDGSLGRAIAAPRRRNGQRQADRRCYLACLA